MNVNPIRNFLLSASLVACAAAPGPLLADDAEIYVNTRDLPEIGRPMVMFSLDYRPNLGNTVCQNGECDFLVQAGMLPEGRSSFTRLEMMRGALMLVLQPLSGVEVGLMINNRYGPGCTTAGPSGQLSGCTNGGYIAMGFRELQQGDANGTKAMFESVLTTLPVPPPGTGGAPSDHSYQGRELFYEFYRYLAGDPVWNALNGFTSFDAVAGGSSSINVVPEYNERWRDTPSEEINGFAWDPTIITGAVESDPATGTYSDVGRYKSPLLNAGDCSKIYTVNFLFQVSNQESDSDAEILRDIGVRNGQGVAREFYPMIEYLNRTDLSQDTPGDQKVISYFLGPNPQYRNTTFARYAQAGGTGSALELSDNPEELVAVLTDIFKQILSVSTTFTSAALPVNTFDRSQVLRDVFLALFQPQVDAYPAANSYWWGNIKKLRLAGDGSADDALRLVDANGDAAIAADGRIRYNAVTFWTDVYGADVVDAGRDPDQNAVSGRDGRSVNRGGAGHKKPGYPRYDGYNPERQNPGGTGTQPASGPRRMFYDSGSALAKLEAEASVAEALQSAIGAASAAEAMQVIKFMRGLDPVTDDPGVVPMLWMFGSVMHSRPVIVNYGAVRDHTRENPMIFVGAGGNDGGFRFIRNTSPSGVELGQEIWSFVPTELMANVRSIVRQEGPQYSGESTIYGFDGPATLFVDDKNGDGNLDHTVGDKAIIYAGLRRGGRGYYALDVSNPEAPQLLWKIVGGQTPGFDNLGLAFSQPQVGRMDLGADRGGVQPVVVFAGGYDRQYDDQTGPISNPKGNAIFVVNAMTGVKLIEVIHDDMVDSIPATVAAVDTAGDGLLDRIVVGDLGGRIWRVDMSPSGTPPENWTVSMLANLGRHAAGGATGGQHDRRFFNQPDVVQTKERFLVGDAEAETVNFDAVLIGTGDRENPLHNAPSNWFFMIRDLNTGILTEADDTAYRMEDLTDVTMTTGQEIPLDSAGWKLQLTTVGEKNLAPALTVANTVFFTTYVPAGANGADICGPAEGGGRLYTVSLKNANPPRNRDEPIDSSDTTVTHDDRWEDLAAGGIPSEVVFIPPNRIMAGLEEPRAVPITTRWRTFWYLEEDPVVNPAP